MLLAGSDDGVYHLAGDLATGELTAEQRLETGAVMRLRTFDALPGTLAATTTGLYHSPDGRAWSRVETPREQVYAVGASPDGGRIYVGTRPAHVYGAPARDAIDGDPDWCELDALQNQPSRDDWRLPRHEDLAQVRDVHAVGDGRGDSLDGTSGDGTSGDRLVVGVEVGGVHVSDDGGDSWAERREGMHDDVHELHVVAADEFVAATGFGLYRTTDAGRSWTRLDEAGGRRYVRSALSVGETLYAGAATASSSSWEDPEADPALFAWREGAGLAAVDHPRPDEVVTGMTAVDGRLVAATHRGSVLVDRGDGLAVAASVPVDADQTGRYTPLTWLDGA